MVPGATNTLSDVCASPDQNPATPSRGKTLTTRSCSVTP